MRGVRRRRQSAVGRRGERTASDAHGLTMSRTHLPLVLTALLAQAGWAGSRFFLTDFLHELPTPATGPQFDTTVPDNLTSLVGQTAELTCRVKNLGNRTVSWVRHRDIHLLTVGRYTYTSDQRFEAIHSPHTEDWTLRIRYPQLRDSGVYECQISTTPPIGHQVYLNIVVPRSQILGGPDIFIDAGSTINLTCLVTHPPDPPPDIVWTHNGQVINFDSPRGGVSLVMEKGAVTTSRLLVQRAVSADTGLYTCTPLNVTPDSVRVHVLSGQTPAAMQHSDCGPRPCCHQWLLLLLTLLTVLTADSC